MKIFKVTYLLIGLLGWTTAKPLESNNDATEALVEIEKQRLIKFPEDFEQLAPGNNATNKNDEAQRILQEIEKINRALGYVKKPENSRVPAILDSSQYLFPNTGYQPFHIQNPQVMGSHGETLLLPSIRSVKFDQLTKEHRASEFNKPPVKKIQKVQKISSKPSKPLYFQPHRVEVPAPQTADEKKLLPTHFVIPVRLYKNSKQEYVEKHSPQEYKIKGYKIVGDIDHFYGKAKNKTTENKLKSSPKYHLLFLPQDVVGKNAVSDIEALSASTSAENSSREEKLANRPLKLQTNSQTLTSGNVINATSSATIIRKRVVPRPQKGESTSVLAVTSSSILKVTPLPPTAGHNQQHPQPQSQQQQQQQYQPQYQKPTNLRPNTQPGVATQTYLSQNAQQQQQQYQKPSNLRPNNVAGVATPTYQQAPTAVETNGNNNNINNNNNDSPNNNNNNNNNNMKNRNPLLNPLLGLQANLQNNINNINNVTSTAIRNAFQNIFRLPFRPDNNNNNNINNNNNNNNKPQISSTGSDNTYPYLETLPLQIPPKQQQQYYYTMISPQPSSAQTPILIADTYQNDHIDSDYKWDDENDSAPDISSSDDIESVTSNESQEPAEKKIFGHFVKQKQETQKEALRQGGIIIQKLKVRKGGIAIAGPGGVATAGSGGTAIVGPGGYALTHPRSLTIAGPGAKVIAIPSDVDLRDALSRTNLKTHMLPREGRIVATGPTVYFAPGTGEAYTTQGLNLLTPAQRFETLNEARRATAPTIDTRNIVKNLRQVAPSQLLTPQPYYVINNPYYANPFTQYTYTASNQYPLQFVQNVASPETVRTPGNREVKDVEPTTKRPQSVIRSKPPKLQVKPQTNGNFVGDFRHDAPLLQGVRQINPEYVIEEIVPIPGRHIISSTVTEKLKQQIKDHQRSQSSKLLARKQTSKMATKRAAKISTNSQVKVEATGRTATSGNIPQIPFGTYFLPYFSQNQEQQEQEQQDVKTSTLILEPHSKAVVGNGGTAISTPISTALLKRGVSTNVYFSPESVAIAGVGGKAHAQADLELGLID